MGYRNRTYVMNYAGQQLHPTLMSPGNYTRNKVALEFSIDNCTKIHETGSLERPSGLAPVSKTQVVGAEPCNRLTSVFLGELIDLSSESVS